MTVDVESWTRSTEEFLAATRNFMRASNNTTFLRGIRGEILTLRQILQTHGIALSRRSARLDYLGSSRRDCDILVSVDNREIRIDCKEKSEGDHWVRLHGRDYADVQVDESTREQRVAMRTDSRDDFYYVFVDSVGFAERGEAELYLLSDREAKGTIGSVYKRRLDGKRRTRNESSDDFWVYPDDLRRFFDNRLERLPL